MNSDICFAVFKEGELLGCTNQFTVAHEIVNEEGADAITKYDDGAPVESMTKEEFQVAYAFVF